MDLAPALSLPPSPTGGSSVGLALPGITAQHPTRNKAKRKPKSCCVGYSSSVDLLADVLDSW